jgi:hypothetical protein
MPIKSFGVHASLVDYRKKITCKSNFNYRMYLTFQSLYVEFANTGTCYSSVGRAYWPFPVSQEK